MYVASPRISAIRCRYQPRPTPWGASDGSTAADCLRERDALAGPGRGSCRCFVSDRQEDFSRLASTFLGWDVAQAVEQVDISQY